MALMVPSIVALAVASATTTTTTAQAYYTMAFIRCIPQKSWKRLVMTWIQAKEIEEPPSKHWLIISRTSGTLFSRIQRHPLASIPIELAQGGSKYDPNMDHEPIKPLLSIKNLTKASHGPLATNQIDHRHPNDSVVANLFYDSLDSLQYHKDPL